MSSSYITRKKVRNNMQSINRNQAILIRSHATFESGVLSGILGDGISFFKILSLFFTPKYCSENDLKFSGDLY